ATNTATSTATSTATDTATSTATATATDTATKTATATATDTATDTATRTATDTASSTATSTATATATATLSEPAVGIALGPAQPGPSVHIPGETGIPDIQFVVTNNSLEPITVDKVIFTATGTGNDMGVTEARLFRGTTFVTGGAYTADNGTMSLSI